MNAVHYFSIPGLKNKNQLKYPARRDPDNIIALVCGHLGKPVKDVLGGRRFQSLIVPKQAIIYLLHTYAGLNKSEIALKLGLDHTTIIYSLKVFKNRMETEEETANLYESLKEIILLTT
jgi:chromosomal replication initiation ATPase DnaA